MINLLSSEGHEALRAMATRPILYAFDFDGTLAGISPDRSAVALSRSIHRWLTELAKRAPCAVVSGRALDDLRPRLNGAVPHLIGNHGLESPLTPPDVLSRAEEICLGWMTRVEKDLARPLQALGVEVEDKRYSLTFHYRKAGESSGIRPALLSILEHLIPTPRCVFGKASVNVLPPGKGGKGEAALALMVHLRQAGLFFIGDDETDEDVFALTEGLVMGVRVGWDADSRARYYVKHQDETEEVIRQLVHSIDGRPDSSNS
jgi:trehalose 6-phosphate phosphatase